jgi:hypothetical protein
MEDRIILKLETCRGTSVQRIEIGHLPRKQHTGGPFVKHREAWRKKKRALLPVYTCGLS